MHIKGKVLKSFKRNPKCYDKLRKHKLDKTLKTNYKKKTLKKSELAEHHFNSINTKKTILPPSTLVLTTG